MSTTRTVTIGAVMKMADLSASTLRVWELRGLIPPPARSGDGRRQYRPEDVVRISSPRAAAEEAQAGIRGRFAVR
jgi:DNA-binding transcriptional MerR regulator